MKHPALARAANEERGDVAFAAVIFLISAVMGMGLLLMTGRMGYLETDLQAAATQAARQASLHQSADMAEAAAKDVIDQAITEWSASCNNREEYVRVQRDGADVLRGSWVEVGISCDIRMWDLSFFAIGMNESESSLQANVTAVSRERVDLYRGES